MPPEIYLYILSFVDARDLGVTCTRVSHDWRDLALDDSLWRGILSQRHPAWRTTFEALDVDVGGMTARERVRFLQVHHDPIERRECCQHDQNKGARCQCCVCVRHHADQQWDAREHDVDGEPYCIGYGYDDGSVFNPELPEHIKIMAKAYASLAVTIEELRRRYEEEYRKFPSMKMPDFDRAFRVLCESGVLRIFGKNRVAWTKQAHLVLRPPFQLFWFQTLTYSDADLMVGTDKDLRNDDIFDKQRVNILAKCDRGIDIDALHRFAGQAYHHLEDRREFDRVMENLARVGWVRLRTTGTTTEATRCRAADELFLRESNLS
jgi:hypothetical protein